MNASTACLSILAASIGAFLAASASASEADLQSLQSQVGARANVVATAKGVFGSGNDGARTVAGNMGSGGQAPGRPALERRTASREAGLASNGRALDQRQVGAQPSPLARSLPPQATTPRRDLASLNPQPLPPVERGRGTVGSDDGKTRPNGIIIVGGKAGASR